VDVVYGGHGALPPDLWVYPVRSLHYLISRMLMALIGLHIAGALYHAVILRDGLLRRMAFGRRLRAARNLAFPALHRPISKAESWHSSCRPRRARNSSASSSTDSSQDGMSRRGSAASSVPTRSSRCCGSTSFVTLPS